MKNINPDTGQRPSPKLRRVLAWAVCVLLVCAGLVLGAVRQVLTDRADQQAAQRWSGDGTAFAQLSLFLPESEALSPRQLQNARSKLAAALSEASLEPVSETARLWLDAASLQLEGSASTDRGSTTVSITAADGDYFYFHPLQLKSGSPFSDADLQHDTIVLDELAAWQLFGSNDVTGRAVKLNGKHYYVCGVAAIPEDAASTLTYGEHARVWIFYDSLPDAEDLALTCYEAVLPEPYTGFAAQLLADAFATENRDCVLRTNSTRYGFVSLWNTAFGFTRAAMRQSGVAYPWWENAAVYIQSHAALLLLAQLLLCIGPALAGLVLLWRLARKLLRKLPTPKQLIERMIDRRRTAAWKAAEHPDALSEEAEDIAAEDVTENAVSDDPTAIFSIDDISPKDVLGEERTETKEPAAVVAAGPLSITETPFGAGPEEENP